MKFELGTRVRVNENMRCAAFRGRLGTVIHRPWQTKVWLRVRFDDSDCPVSWYRGYFDIEDDVIGQYGQEPKL